MPAPPFARGGRPRDLTQQVQDTVRDQFELGHGWVQAGEAAGKHPGTLEGWDKRGRVEVARRDEPIPTDPLGILGWCALAAKEQDFVGFTEAVTSARVAGRNRLVGVLHGATIWHEAKRTVRTVTRTKVVDGKEVTETETTEITEHAAPSVMAALTILERQYSKDGWAKRTVLTGPDDGPIQVQAPEDVARQAEEWLAELRGGDG